MRTKVTTTTRATGGTGKAIAGPPKEERSKEEPTRLRKGKGKVTAPSATSAGVMGTSPVTAPTVKPWAKEALKEEEKEGRQDTKEVKEVKQERKEGTRVTKEAGTSTAKEGGAQEAKVTRVARVATKGLQEQVQEEVRREPKEVTEEDSSLTAKGNVTVVAKKVTSELTALSRPMRLTAAQGGTSPVPWASSSPAATPLRRGQEKTR